MLSKRLLSTISLLIYAIIFLALYCNVSSLNTGYYIYVIRYIALISTTICMFIIYCDTRTPEWKTVEYIVFFYYIFSLVMMGIIYIFTSLPFDTVYIIDLLSGCLTIPLFYLSCRKEKISSPMYTIDNDYVFNGGIA